MPANDDAGRAIALYCDLIAKAAVDGIARGHGDLGIDIGAAESPIETELPANTNDAVETESPEPTEAFELLTAPRGAPDDLTKLTGVGPQLDKKLNDAGIFHYWQIGALKAEDVTKLEADLKLNGRIDRDNWSSQARALIDAA